MVFSAGSFVGRVVVSDADSEELTQLQYLVTSGNERGLFIINMTTGNITTAAEIDREEGDSYTLTIEVRPSISS